jgi:phosphopantetheinyl transferase
MPISRAVRVVVRRGLDHETAAARVLAEALGIAPGDLELQRDARGKPAIRVPATDLRFSVAHTSGLTLVALAHDVDVGVDVESLARDVTGWAMWDQIITECEAVHLPASQTTRNALLLQMWVRREALLKAAGIGLSVDPATIELTPHGRIVGLPLNLSTPREWSLHDIAIPGCAAAVACRSDRTQVEVEDQAWSNDHHGSSSLQP